MIVGVTKRLGGHHQNYGPDSFPALDGVDEWVVKARTRVHLKLPCEPPIDLIDVVLHLQFDLVDDGGPLLAQIPVNLSHRVVSAYITFVGLRVSQDPSSAYVLLGNGR